MKEFNQHLLYKGIRHLKSSGDKYLWDIVKKQAVLILPFDKQETSLSRQL